jgi:hypothetical protein
MLLSLRDDKGRPIALCSFGRMEAILRYHLLGIKPEERTGYYWKPGPKQALDDYTFYYTAYEHWGLLPKLIEGVAWRPLEWLPPHGLDFYGNATGVKWNVELLTQLVTDWYDGLPTPDWAVNYDDADFDYEHIDTTALKLHEAGVI